MYRSTCTVCHCTYGIHSVLYTCLTHILRRRIERAESSRKLLYPTTTKNGLHPSSTLLLQHYSKGDVEDAWHRRQRYRQSQSQSQSRRYIVDVQAKVNITAAGSMAFTCTVISNMHVL